MPCVAGAIFLEGALPFQLARVRFLPVTLPKSEARSSAARMTPQKSLADSRIWFVEREEPSRSEFLPPWKVTVAFWPRAETVESTEPRSKREEVPNFILKRLAQRIPAVVEQLKLKQRCSAQQLESRRTQEAGADLEEFIPWGLAFCPR